jgi:hypothetical protein
VDAPQYGSLREKIAAESVARKRDYALYAVAIGKAHEAGMAAVAAIVPDPMVVVNNQTGQRYFVEGGVCGFAWTHVPDGKGRFARWLTRENVGHKSYYGGVDISAHTGDQSMQRNEAYAHAYARTLRDTLGVEAYAQSRID